MDEALVKEAEKYIIGKQEPINKYDLAAFAEAHIEELRQSKKGKIVEHFEAYGQCRDSRRIAELEETINKLREQFALRYDLEDKIKELESQLEREKNLNQCMSDNNEQLREQIEKMKCCKEEILKELKETLDYEWLPAHNGKAKYVYLQTVIDIVVEKFEEIK